MKTTLKLERTSDIFATLFHTLLFYFTHTECNSSFHIPFRQVILVEKFAVAVAVVLTALGSGVHLVRI